MGWMQSNKFTFKHILHTYTHVLRFEHLIEHVGSLLGAGKKKGRAFGLTNLYFKKCTISKLSNNKQTCTIMDVLWAQMTRVNIVLAFELIFIACLH